MRKLILYIAASLDGYIARADGALDWLPAPNSDTGDDYGYGALMARCDTVLYGRKTYEFMQAQGEQFIPDKTNYLFSRTWADPLPPEVSLVASPLAEIVSELRRLPGTDLWLVGGGGLIAEALAADLLDEIQLATVPVLLGEGIPLWAGGHPERSYELTSSRKAGGMLLSLYQKIIHRM
jgi:dihydrofolate reductase